MAGTEPAINALGELVRRLPILAIAVFLICGNTGVAVRAAGINQVVGLRRLTEQEYRNSIADIFGKEINVSGMFEPQVRMGGLEATSSAILSVTPAGFESFSKMADSIAVQVTDEKHRGKAVSCKPIDAKAPDDACAHEFLSHYGLLLFRRPLTESELKARVTLARTMTKSTGAFYNGLHFGLAQLIQSPNFLFRKELALKEGDGLTLEPYSRATRLSYLLWDSTPDAELLESAKNGELNTPAGLEKQVNRLLAAPRLEAGMRAFFNDMLMLDTFDTVSKDALLYPKWGGAMAPSAKEETLRSVIGLTLKDNGDLRDLMTTRKTYINRSLAAIYDVDFTFDGDWVPYEFPKSSGRSGINTQVAMLSMFSHPGQSSPTKRGVALMDIFLCEPTPAPPANVDFSAVNNTAGPMKTVRERLMAHATTPTCASCHTHSDPIGLSLEGFDTIGGRRLYENGQLIDVTASLRGKTFADGVGLGQYLHDNAKFPACVARKLYAYGRGMDVEEVKPDQFRVAYKSFIDSGFRLRALIRGIGISPEFYAAPAPVEEASVGLTKHASN
ncbi:MAG: DUF1592 domain-containing protein [Alphaproteobacteria bacterium]|nr:DUF1592 domain-containing protein [Alphaproteobacteria bacterium]